MDNNWKVIASVNPIEAKAYEVGDKWVVVFSGFGPRDADRVDRDLLNLLAENAIARAKAERQAQQFPVVGASFQGSSIIGFTKEQKDEIRQIVKEVLRDG